MYQLSDQEKSKQALKEEKKTVPEVFDHLLL